MGSDNGGKAAAVLYNGCCHTKKLILDGYSVFCLKK
jgi:hypothetical protein